MENKKKKKGYYIYVENCGSSGVMKKIRMQVDSFSKFLDIKALMIPNKKIGRLKRLYNMLPWSSFARDYESILNEMDSPDFVYIRRTYVDRLYLKFLKEIHLRWKTCKIIVEQPVYPYDRDMLNSPYTAVQYIKEIIFRQHYKDDIDRFVTYSDDEEILGVKTIRTMNGINVSEIKPINTRREYCTNNINLIAVATLVAHHGYERVIKGLYHYYNNEGDRNIVFHIVGDGPEKQSYIDMVNEYKLQEHVIFHGAKYGNELDKMYELADAGLAAFGSYKEGIKKLCTIKAREYLAKGIPVVLGCEDNLFINEAERYGLIFPNDNSPIDIAALATFLDNLYENNTKAELVKEIVNLAKRTVDNDITLREVVDYICS